MTFSHLKYCVRLLPLFFILFGCGSIGYTQTWGSSAGSPANLAQHTAVVGTNNLVYVFGGWDGSTLSNSLYIFNPATNSWATGANYPIATRGLTSALGSDGLIYGFSGVTSGTVTNCYRYDPNTDIWTTIANIPNACWMSDAVSIGDKIYVTGGEGALTNLQIYDIASNTWSSGANLPNSGTHQHESAHYNGKLYVVAGADGGNYSSARLSVYIYDTASNVWSTGASMTTGRYQPGAVIDNAGNIFVFGGSSSGVNGSGTYYSSVEIYDTGNDTWSVGTPLPSASGETQAVIVNGVAYVIGGYNGSSYTSTVANSPIDAQNSLDFDGTNDHVSIPHNAALNLTAEWSMEAWVRPDVNNGTYQALISKGVSPRPVSLWQYQNKIQVWFDPVVNDVIESNHTLVIGEWVHVAATYNNNTLKLYINGQLDNTTTSSDPSINSSSALYLGQRGDNSSYFNGRLDEVRLWSTERTAAEIQAYYQCQVDAGYTDLIAYYSFNNPDVGAGENNAGNTYLADTSGNGHNGTLVNFALSGNTSNWEEQTDSVSSNCDPNIDVTPPVSVPFQNVTLYLGSNGTATLSGTTADSASTDAGSGIATRTLSNSSFNCDDVGSQTVQLIIEDNSGNRDSADFTLLVLDTVGPTISTNNVTVYLDGTGNASVTATQVNNSSYDSCGIATVIVDVSNFTCSNVGANNVTLTATDNNGNASSGLATVAVLDTINPVAVAADTTIYLNAAGAASLTAAMIGYASTDNCSIDNLTLNQTDFDCSDVGTAFKIALTATDPSGNQSIDSAQITVLDSVSPVALTNDTTLYLNGSGTASITAAEIDNGSYDSCGIASLSIDSSNFDCSETGVNVVTLTVTDNNGNSSSGAANVTVLDTIRPVAVAKDTTIYLNNAGNASLTAAELNDGSTDNCGIASLNLSTNSFDCSNLAGTVSVTLTATDASGNTGTDQSLVTVLDSIKPTVIPVANLVVYLDNDGEASITSAQVDSASGDNCAITSLSLNDSLFDCTDVGSTIHVLLTATDASGNQQTDSALIVLLDTVAPVAITNDVTVYLNGSGNASITAAEINNGSYDSCGIASLSIDSASFDCSEAGVNVVTLTVTDNNGNVSTATSNVTVIDSVSPTAVAVDTTLYLDANGESAITSNEIGYGSSDNCSSISLALNDSTFDCSDAGTTVNVTLTVTDPAGNSSTDVAAITVIDSTAPSAIAADTTIYLDANGNASLTASQIGYASTDNCGIDSLHLAQTIFDCSDVGSTLNIALTAFDPAGNQATDTAMITVLDTFSPVAIASDTTLYLNGSGTATITAAEINNGSYDSCGIASIVIDSANFDCSEAGVNVVTLTITDNNGNVSTATSNVTVIDSVSPAAIAVDTTLYLDANGEAAITSNEIGYGSSDNCSSISLALNDSTFDCSDAGTTVNVTLTVTDPAGNSSTDVAAITVIDSTAPSAIATDTTIYLDANGNASLTASQVGYASTDNCGIDSLHLAQTSFDCSDVGSTLNIALTAFDPAGNQATDTAMITVLDTVSPVAIVSDTTLYLDGSGTASITATQINNGSFDSCGIASLSIDSANFDCSEEGLNTVTLTVTDNNGNVSTATANVTVMDTLTPTAVAVDTILYLDANGQTSVFASQIGYGSFDNCSSFSLTLNDSTFDCSDAGTTVNITLTATDPAGNSSTDISAITIIDSTAPTPIAADTTIYLDATGNASLTAAQIGYTSSDNCGIDSLALAQTSFDCSDVGSTLSIALIAFDLSGNQTTDTAMITVLDTVSPVAMANDTTLYLNGSGTASITAAEINNGSYDSCGIASLSIDSANFNCAETGVNTVTLTVTDNYGNASTATSTVTVLDTISPVALAIDTTIYLDANGTAAITSAEIGAGSSDNCSSISLLLNDSTFDCADAGTTLNIELIVTDPSGNQSTDSAMITVLDTVSPVAIAQNVAAYLDNNGEVNITTSAINNDSYDSCGIASLQLDTSFFDCTSTGIAETVVLTVTDVNGNTNSTAALVTVLDTVAPLAVTRNLIVFLDNDGFAMIQPDTLDSASMDNCSIDSIAISQNTFDCSNAGTTVPVTFYAADASGNLDSALASVTVIDTTAPVVQTQNITVHLSATGAVSISPNQVDNGSTDSCGIASFALDIDSFDCGDVGVNPIVLTVTDAHGNFSSASANVTVIDSTAPTIITQNITLGLDANGQATLMASMVSAGTWDSCGLDSIGIDTSNFDCIAAGNTYPVTISAFDVNGNSSAAIAQVSVIDTVDPIVFTQSVLLALDSQGNAVLAPESVDSASSDACGIAALALDINSFDCTDIGAAVSVTLTVTDSNGNSATGTALVTIIDTIAPEVLTQNTTVYLDAAGTANLTTAEVNNGTNDACGIQSLALDVSAFTCAEAGDTVTVTLTATDVNGNQHSDTALVTILDTISPTVTTQDISVYLSSAGSASITSAIINNGSSDNCAIDSMWLDINSFNCAEAGVNAVTLTVLDVNGNSQSASATVTVIDTVPPTILVSATNAYLDVNGQINLTPALFDLGSYDSCGIASTSLDTAFFDCTAANNPYTVIFSATDVNGNTASQATSVTILDTLFPVASAQDITVYLDNSGAVSISATQLNNGSTDNCSVDSLALSQSGFDCADTDSAVAVTLYVFDPSGNQDSVEAFVTVVDSIPPAVVTQNISAYLDPFGAATITPQMIDNGSSDVCGIDTMFLDSSNLSCSNLGIPLTVTLTVVDSNGNTNSGTATVMTLDTVPPNAVAQNLTIYLDSAGLATIDADSVDGGTTGLCSIDSIAISTSSFSCAEAGDTIQIVFSAFDQSANEDTAHATITVLDTIGPAVLPFSNLNVYLDGSGSAAITPQMVDSASFDACGIDSLWLDSNSFSCENLDSAIIVTLFAMDVNGNTWSATSTIQVLDTIAPTISAFANLDLALDVNGNASLLSSQIDNGSSDACGVASYALDTTNFTCASAGITIPVTLTVTDSSGNASQAIAMVSILDSIAPMAFAQDLTVALDSFGNATINTTQVDSGSSDACGIASYVLSVDSFSCIEAGTTVPVVLTVTDINGNIATDSAEITVIDTIAPLAIAQDLTISLDAFGLASISADSMDNGSSDACGISSLVIDSSNFSCENLFNPVTVTLTATDSNGNSLSATATVTVIDDLAPNALAQNITVHLDDNGMASTIPDSIDNGSNDNCGVESMSLDVFNFSCADIPNNPTQVILTVTDTSGNSDTTHAYVTVIDTVTPAVITQDLTVYLDANGLASITPNEVDNGSSDACGISSYALDSSSFDCTNLDTTVTVVLTVTDENTNEASESATVTILDTISPTAIAQNLTIQLDSFGLAVIDADSVNNGSFDNCAVDSIAISIDSFDCGDVGAPVAVTLTVFDKSGNSTTDNALITVEDLVAPVVQMQNDTVYLDANGLASIQPIDVDSGSWDSCGIVSYVLSTSNFDCSNLFTPVTVVMAVTDANGNSSIDSSIVVVEDSLAPQAIAQNLTIQLDSFGLAVIDADSINNGSLDNCTISAISIDIDSFDCGDVGSPVAVLLTVTDQSGNSDTATAIVTVEDVIAPQVITNDLIVYLNASGTASILPDSIDNGSWDSCGIALLELDSSNFGCENLSTPLTVTLTATDFNGNMNSETAIVTVLDTLAPTVLASPDTFYLDINGEFTVDYLTIDAGSFDNCAIETMYLSDSAFDCTVADSTFNVWLIAVDSSNNADSVNVAFTFLDTLLPEITCPVDITVSNDAGQCGAVVSFSDPVTTDNCSIDSIVQIDTNGLVSGNSFPVGVTTLRFVAYDPSGNTDTCSFNIEVEDVEAPVIICSADTVICDSIFTYPLPTYTDNCTGFDIIQIDGIASDSAYPVGVTTNRFVVTDAYGNSDTCSFEVTRNDFPTVAVVDSNIAQCEAALANIGANNPTVGTGAWSIIQGSGTIADPAANSTTISGLPTGTTRLTWTISNGVCPPTADTLTVDIFVSPSQANVSSTQVLCEEESATIVADAPAIGSGVWRSLSNSAFITDSTATQTSVTNLSIDDHRFVWQIDNGVCPPTSDTVLISNNPFPVIFTSDNKEIFPPSSVPIQVFYDIGSTFNWEPKTTIVNDTNDIAIVAPANTQTYTVTVTSEAGCASMTSTTVFVNGDLEIPTAFTPDNDGINDKWNIEELKNYPSCQVEVIDRDGNRIFFSEGYETPWDGTYRGEVLPMDSYFFIINLKVGLIDPITGSVTIVK